MRFLPSLVTIMTEIILYDYPKSSAAYRVRIALNLAKLAYRSVPVNLLDGAHKSPAHLARNPQGLVPVLEIDGMSLTQSLSIITYLNDTRHLGLIPADPQRHARISAAVYAIASDLHPVCNLSVMRHATKGQEPARTQWMHHFIRPGLLAFEALISADGFKEANGPFCGGDRLSMADLCLIPQLYNATRWGVPYDDCPHIIEAENACASLDAFAKAYPEA